jgi:hypothetical protein
LISLRASSIGTAATWPMQRRHLLSLAGEGQVDRVVTLLRPTPLARGGGKPPWSPACVGPTATMGQDLAALGLVAEVLPRSPQATRSTAKRRGRQTVTKLVVVTTSEACNNARYPNRRTW